MTRATGCGVAALLVVVALLGGCSDDETDPQRREPVAEPTVDVDQAQQVYSPLMAAVSEAVAEVSVPARSAGEPEVIYYASDLESCVFASLSYDYDTVFGEVVSWDDVRAATDEVLAPEGFELTDQLEIPGGFNGFDATTDDGTRLEVRSKLGGPSTLSLDAPVLGDCDRERSEQLPPLPN